MIALRGLAINVVFLNLASSLASFCRQASDICFSFHSTIISTYIAANMVMSLCEKYQQDPTYFKLGVTSAVNMGAGITKDSLFARWFGQQV